MLRRPTFLALLLLALLAAAAPAHAATVQVANDPDDFTRDGPPVLAVFVDAVPGERDDLRLVLGADGSVVVADPRVPPTPGAGCAQLTRTSVSCTIATPSRFVVSVGDEDDRVRVTDRRRTLSTNVGFGGQVQVDGGAGDDVLEGGAHSDLLTAGAGADVLRGGGGNDRFELGDRDSDARVGARPAPARRDRVDGGPGRDTVSYTGEPGGVRVHLAPPQGGGRRGAPARRLDTYTRVEQVDGTARADVLVGSDGDDGLFGAGGDDVLRGGRGDDGLTGSGTLDGGPGDDALRPGSSLPADLRCGPGADRLSELDAKDLVEGDCEAVDLLGSARLSPRPTRTAQGLGVTVACTAPQPNASPFGCPPGSRLAVAVRTPSADSAFSGRAPFDLPLAAGSYVVPPTGATSAPTPLALPVAGGAAPAVLARRSRQVVVVSVAGALPGPSQFALGLGEWQVALPASG